MAILTQVGEIVMFDLLDKLSLERRPHDPTGTLRAWNAADAHLLEAWKAWTQEEKASHHLIINDAFGALTCGILALEANETVENWNDSMAARKATRDNLLRNGLTEDNVSWLSLSQQPRQTSAAWMKIPGSLSRLAWQLESLLSCMPNDFTLFASVMCKYESRALYDMLRTHFDAVESSRAQRKARLITCRQPRKDKRARANVWTTTSYEDRRWELASLPGVFAQGKVDVGTRFLLQHLPATKVASTLDLGCGNGIIGLAVLEAGLTDNMIFLDESMAAVASARETVLRNLPEAVGSCAFVADDDLSSLPDNSLNRILCNPPFHQTGAVTEHVAKHLFLEAWRCLAPGGECYVVANRHLAYGPVLSRLFGGFRVLATNRKFTIFQCVKRQRQPSSVSRGLRKTVS
jgi:16S rRNA G1207 methylase RsmC